MTLQSSHNASKRVASLALLLLLALIGLVVLSTGLGFIRISPGAVLRVIVERVVGDTGLAAGLDPLFSYVVMDVRLPRILTAAVVGAGLAVCGVLFQGILLNPLADPYTLGISSGAAFGASLALVANVTLFGVYSVPLFAFAGAIATLLVVLYLSSFDGQMSANTLILSGVIVGAILAAGISFMKYMADEQVAMIIYWLMGSFAAKSWTDVLLALLAVSAGLAVAVFYGRDLNIMSLGGRSSDSLGVETARVRKILLITGSLVAAVCVSVSGIIGFIGLIVPHLMRFLIGPDNRRLAVLSALAGGILLLCADTVTRAVLPVEVPIGVLTALIGGPFFCYIFRRRQRGIAHG
ncbi:MAG: iron ABC transporter permease [Desulfobulbaceae bacterium]|nr:iron ABC transporter permease [Desulfobulbaceae bacterium]